MSDAVTPITSEPRYKEIIARWEAFWSLEDVGRPLWMIPSSPVLSAGATGRISWRPLLQDRETQLNAQLALLQWRQSADVGDDFVPHLQANQGVTVFASAFGCEVQYFDHTLSWAHPVIRPEDPPEKVYELPSPAITDGQLGTILEWGDYFVERTAGRYALGLTDLQGPLDSSYLVWEPAAFMVAMRTNPKEVHHLMRAMTDLIIRFVREQRSRVPEFMPCHFPPVWLPDGRGISMSDDCLAVLSPALYEEFALPYVNELSDEFGGVFVHSCGNFAHQLGNLEKVHNLRGLNFEASEMPFEHVWERFGGRTAIVVHLGLNKAIHFDTEADYVRHILRTKTHDRGLCVLVLPPGAGGSTADSHISAGAGVGSGASLTDFIEEMRGLLAPVR
ncbi:MAG: uroporphyrinogen decarboxylase family protein [Planctomycetota bacterium]|jgi:uroporphyrinogen-III decarboxylase